MTNPYLGQWEERWHPLLDEWIIVAAHRNNRPWSGDTVEKSNAIIPEHDPDCYLCPGNSRVSGSQNPHYESTYVFDNDHPCVGPAAPDPPPTAPGIYRNRAATGVARVICYSSKHNLTLAEMDSSEVENVVAAWQRETVNLGARPEVNNVLIFENKGEVSGVSNPHPHGQLYATNFIFRAIERHVAAGVRHCAETGNVLFQDIICTEQSDGKRIVAESEHSIAFVPYFARYAYEVHVAPKRTHAHVSTLSDAEARDFAHLLRTVLIKYDNLWQMSFPYLMILHQAPTDGSDYRSGNYRGFHFHIELLPPLRKPNILKHLASPEIGGGNFLTVSVPAEKAAALRELSDVHYKRV